MTRGLARVPMGAEELDRRITHVEDQIEAVVARGLPRAERVRAYEEGIQRLLTLAFDERYGRELDMMVRLHRLLASWYGRVRDLRALGS